MLFLEFQHIPSTASNPKPSRIRLRYRVNKSPYKYERIDDVKILNQYWDDSKKRVSLDHPKARVFNIRLMDIEESIEKYYNNTGTIDTEKVRALINGRRFNTDSFNEFVKRLLARKENPHGREISTLKKLNKHFPNTTFSELSNPDWGEYFIDKLSTLRNEKTNLKLSSSSVLQIIQQTRRFLKFAVKFRKIKYNPIPELLIIENDRQRKSPLPVWAFWNLLFLEDTKYKEPSNDFFQLIKNEKNKIDWLDTIYLPEVSEILNIKRKDRAFFLDEKTGDNEKHKLNRIKSFLLNATPERFERLKRAYIVLLTASLTGLRIGDIIPYRHKKTGLRLRDFVKTNGNWEIEKVPSKTKKHGIEVLIPLSMFEGRMEKIFHRFRHGKSRDDLLLPEISYSSVHSYSYIIEKMLGVNIRFSPHIGRHTLSDLLNRVYKLPQEEIMQMLGHTNYDTSMNVYAGNRKEKVRDRFKN